MLAQIGFKSQYRTHSLISRIPSGKLWSFCRNVKTPKCGIVTLLIPEILLFFNISRSTLYRWLKQGRELGYFRYYKKTGKFTLYIVLGGKKAVTENLGLTDWGAVVEKPLKTVLNKKENQLRQQTTLHHAQWLEMKSKYAANAASPKGTTAGNKRYRPYKPKFNTGKPTKKAVGKPVLKNPCGATSKTTPPNMRRNSCNDRQASQTDRQETQPIKLKKYAFSRNHTPTGSSQKTIAEQLGVSVRTVTRHLAKTESVQVMYKITDPDEIRQAKAEIYLSIEEGKTPRYFVREGEVYRFGNSLYNLNETLKSEFTQRVKYKFNLFKEILRAAELINKKNLLFNQFNGNFDEFKELFNNFKLDSLDEYVLKIMFYYNQLSSFKEFFDNLKYELRRLKKWNKRKHTQLPPILAGR